MLTEVNKDFTFTMKAILQLKLIFFTVQQDRKFYNSGRS